MFFSSLLNSDYSFVCFPNFCHKKLFCFREYLFTAKNSALFIFQCTICLDSFSVNACPSGSLADSLIILPYYSLFVNTFFEKNFIFLCPCFVAPYVVLLCMHCTLYIAYIKIITQKNFYVFLKKTKFLQKKGRLPPPMVFAFCTIPPDTAYSKYISISNNSITCHLEIILAHRQ